MGLLGGGSRLSVAPPGRLTRIVRPRDFPTMRHGEYLGEILGFLEQVGLEVRREQIEADTFLPGIAIRAGAVVLDESKLEWPGDLLHEAGHLAVLPPAERSRASDALQNLPQLQGAGELEAMAWAYAAACHLNLPLDVLFHEGGYKGNSKGLIRTYSLGVYPGVRGLCDAGMTTARGFTSNNTGAQYPEMIRWLHA